MTQVTFKGTLMMLKRREPHLLGQTPGHLYRQSAPESSETSL